MLGLEVDHIDVPREGRAEAHPKEVPAEPLLLAYGVGEAQVAEGRYLPHRNPRKESHIDSPRIVPFQKNDLVPRIGKKFLHPFLEEKSVFYLLETEDVRI